VLETETSVNNGAPNKPATPKQAKAFYNADKVRGRT